MTGVYATMRLKLCKKGLGLVCYRTLQLYCEDLGHAPPPPAAAVTV